MFDGPDVTPHDEKRLSTLLERVKIFTADGGWYSLAEIAAGCRGSEASVSARLRDLRKQRFGGFEVDRRRRVNKHGGVIEGVWEYRVLNPQSVKTGNGASS